MIIQEITGGAITGYFQLQDNKFYLSNTGTTTPLIYAEFTDGFVKINGGLRSTIITLNAASYTILKNDKIISVIYTVTGAVDVTLPTPADGMDYTIKDAGGNAATNTIKIHPSATETIDGTTGITIVTNYGVANLYSDGTNWFTY